MTTHWSNISWNLGNNPGVGLSIPGNQNGKAGTRGGEKGVFPLFSDDLSCMRG